MTAKMKYSLPGRLLEKPDECVCDLNNPYETTNQRDFKGLDGYPANNARPDTSQFYSDKKTGNTGYNEEYGWKTVVQENLDRNGTSSGQRKNNPHPKETFMVWKFQNQDPNKESNFSQKELLEEICKDKIRSTYQVDYTGLKQGESIEPSDSSKFLPEKKKEPQKTINTTIRVDYQAPLFERSLNGKASRYGSNSGKGLPATGAVPTVVNGVNTAYDTWYNKEFKGTDKKTDNPDIAQYLKNMTVHEKQVVADMLHSLKTEKNTQNNQERFSSWDGPSWK